MAELADQYKDVRCSSALQATGKGIMYPPKKGDEDKKQSRVQNNDTFQKQNKFIQRSEHVHVRGLSVKFVDNLEKKNLPNSGVMYENDILVKFKFRFIGLQNFITNEAQIVLTPSHAKRTQTYTRTLK
jgi:hypothetical protein